jgi:hypothetical protein
MKERKKERKKEKEKNRKKRKNSSQIPSPYFRMFAEYKFKFFSFFLTN